MTKLWGIREPSRQLLGDDIAEIVLRRIPGEVLERKYNNRKTRRCRPWLPGRENFPRYCQYVVQ